VERDCTDQEREEAGADDNDDCTRFVPLVVFDDDEKRRNTETWESGQDILVTGDLREVTVVQGSEGEVEFEWHAQAALAQGREQDVVDATMKHLSASSNSSASTVTFEADRGSSDADLGAALVIKLPPEFDARLHIDKRKERGGDVAIKYLGDAIELEVDMNDLGEDLTIGDAASLRRAVVNTTGDIEMTSAFGEVLQAAVLHSEFGDIVARFAAEPTSHARVISDFGDVSVEVGASANFTLTAEADTVTFNGLPSTCSTRTDSETSKSLLCNDGDPDGLTFEVVASGEVTVRM
jgi:hypothetical protein